MVQVVTASADSSLAVWDVDTGCKTLEVKHAHGEEEITCVALDHTHRHLLTGASNGTIKATHILNTKNCLKTIAPTPRYTLLTHDLLCWHETVHET